jgi:hypothetical protein
MLKFYGLIAFIVCLICGFGLFQIINTNKPMIDSEVQTVVTDLRQLSPANKEQGKISVPSDLKINQITPKTPEAKVEIAPKQPEPAPQNVFERGGFDIQKDAYRI